MKKSIIYKAICLILPVIALFIFSVHGACALGIAPGERPFVYDGKQIEYEIRIMNDEHRDTVYSIDVTGELAKYVSLSKQVVSFTSDKNDEVVYVKFFIPETEEVSPGEYTVMISVKTSGETKTGVTAYVGVVSRLELTLPGNGSYIKINPYVPNFIKGKENSFSIDVVNKGSKTAKNCFAVVDVYTSMNSKVVSLISNRIDVSSLRIENILIPWTPDVNNGQYLAKMSVICDEASAKTESSFSIGSPSIKVVNFVSSDFTLGEINRFDLILESEWGENIDNIYADVEFAKDGNSLSRAKTESINVRPLATVSLPVYLDTKGMSNGKYSLYIMVHYLDKDEGKIYDVTVTENKLSVDQLSGLVVGGKGVDESPTDGTNALLILAIIAIVIVNVVLVLRLIKRKGPDNNTNNGSSSQENAPSKIDISKVKGKK